MSAKLVVRIGAVVFAHLSFLFMGCTVVALLYVVFAL